ncbi:hypothetical protein WJX75_005241 [Coccomyxa subellipsoidea]|uniref:Uncharacterized protein n=1 Tax=Coccomyxa subellipsoidea TaxID=248742 RepID=A0ABR2YUS0_9CHLO
MSGDRKHKLPDHVVAPEGTNLFRTINFERYVRPTGGMRLTAYIGTAAFLGFFAYMAFQKDSSAKQQSLQKQHPERPVEAAKAARAALLERRKDALKAGKAVLQPAPTAHYVGRAAAAAASEVHMKVEGVLSAMVALAAAGRPEAVRVVLMSAEEAASGKDAWDTSAHQVFRRASDVAMQALAYFADRARLSHSHKDFDPSAVDLIASSSALEDFLLFLCTYRDLFTRPCSATGKFLALDPVSNQLLPPIVRPFKRSKSELLAAAKNAEPCQAFHLHVEVPTAELT